MIKDKVEERVLMKGNCVKVAKISTGLVLEVFDGVYDPADDNSGCEFGGQRVSFSSLKSFLNFEEQYKREPDGRLVSRAIMSIEPTGRGSYYIASVDMSGSDYVLTISLNGETLCTAKVEFIHQIQNIITTITGENV